MTWTDFREPWHRAEGDSARTFEAEAATEIAVSATLETEADPTVENEATGSCVSSLPGLGF
jgi:hypothetical protein